MINSLCESYWVTKQVHFALNLTTIRFWSPWMQQLCLSRSTQYPKPLSSPLWLICTVKSGMVQFANLSCTTLGIIPVMFIVTASISYQITCSPSVDSDQPTHSHSLVRVSAQSGQSLCCLHESDFQSSISLSSCPFEDSLLLFWLKPQKYNLHFRGQYAFYLYIN